MIIGTVGMMQAGEKPNIVVILADDMGYGELSCLNPEKGKIKTPALDQIASEGMVFTDGHSGSSVCTPTRYGLMTGRYAWRTKLQSGVLTGGESLIKADRLTVAKLLKGQGYDTAMIGKWHLGMLFDGKKESGKVAVGTKVSHGPIERGGFDVFHGFHHARQMSLWIDGQEVTKNLEPVEMLPMLTQAAVDYIDGRKGQEKPFFLYVPWNSPHSPVVPSKEWKGKSGLNAHADFVMQTDASYGQVVDALKRNGLYENTLVICSADNGTSAPTSKMKDLISKGHHPSADLRGSKADLWDGGHRVPFIVSWPGKVKAGTRSDALVCLTDVMATAADILDVNLPASEGVDSLSMLPALTGKKEGVRTNVVHHSVSGLFAIRDGEWKLLISPGSGGWTAPRPGAAAAKGEPMLQLYNMDKDLGEQNNLIESMPEKAKALRGLLDMQIERGRSTPGEAQKNDVPIKVEKISQVKKNKKKK
ncbi:sulfatase family protein [Rubritalea tangerina]|uniref:sulfatase family protein n=1 Tax=Rubritalea tangerina TaxID=430798 RepID=UPI003610DD39